MTQNNKTSTYTKGMEIRRQVLGNKHVENTIKNTNKIDEKFKESIISKIPSGRLGKPEDIANAVIFLASPKSDYINGETIHVNGGLYLGCLLYTSPSPRDS